MPIVEDATPGAALTQGDILQGIRLFATKHTNQGGEASELKTTLSLVLSRPCAAMRQPKVCVAAVTKYAGDIPAELKGFDDILGFFTHTRNGSDAPDVFYLGEIPGHSGRFCARFDSIHTVEIPVDAPSRTQFIAAHRIAKLHSEFCHDLHQRQFRAFASLGFDDVSWFSTSDLKLLVSEGTAELANATAELKQAESTRNRKEFNQGTYPEKQIEKLQATVNALTEKLSPFQKELASRLSAAT